MLHQHKAESCDILFQVHLGLLAYASIAAAPDNKEDCIVPEQACPGKQGMLDIIKACPGKQGILDIMKACLCAS